MNAELTNKLLEKYPQIFIKTKFFGFECGDGWFSIIDNACGIIQHDIDWNNATGKFSHFKPREPLKNQFVAIQVKEKFGGLRFYYSGGSDFTNGVINMAEAMSYITCEFCGQKGSQRNEGWIITLCDQHFQERQEKKKDKTETVKQVLSEETDVEE